MVAQCGEAGSPSRCIDGKAYEQQQQREQKLNRLLKQLTRRKGLEADEALAVLMCFYLGDSQEETDAVINRGRRMLKYLGKYRFAVPVLPGRAYSASMLKKSSAKADDFAGAIKAIRKGWHRTADTPQG